MQNHAYLWGALHPGSSRCASFCSVTIASRGTSGTRYLKKQYNASKLYFLSLMRCPPRSSWQRSLARHLKFHEGVHIIRKFYTTTTKRGVISKLNNHYYPYQHITTHTKWHSRSCCSRSKCVKTAIAVVTAENRSKVMNGTDKKKETI